MAALTSAGAFAAASSAMVRGVDVSSTIQVLITDCVHLLGADAAGILVRIGDDDLELLAASSHQATELEVHQSQAGAGPCFEAVTTGERVAVTSDADLEHRWPDFAAEMKRAGFQTVHATPMHWRGHTLGGLNAFWTAPTELAESDVETLQGFADTCTLAIAQGPRVDDQQRLAEHLHEALRGRVVIERAKGVLAEQEDLDMAAAFDRLVELSQSRGLPLTTTAVDVANDAHAR